MVSIRSIYIEKGVEDKADLMSFTLSQDVRILQAPPGEVDYHRGKLHLSLVSKRGKVMHPCASLSPEYICCNVQVLEVVENCPFECTYCFLQGYLTDGRLKLVADIDAIMEEVRARTEAEPRRFFRIGTWELGDSLALEPVAGTASRLVEAFASIPNAVLELKTKSDAVDRLLDIEHGGRTVVSWSLNPQGVIGREELKTAPLHARLSAMEKVVEAGYPVGIHFDPMILYDGWQREYDGLVRDIFKTIPRERIAWISIGSLRFKPETRRMIEENFPGTTITTGEMVLGPDGLLRYVKPIRLSLYDHIYNSILKYGGRDNLVYLCMERWDVWEKVIGYAPRSIGHLDYIFADSLHRRFDGFVSQAPDISLYESSVSW